MKGEKVMKWKTEETLLDIAEWTVAILSGIALIAVLVMLFKIL